MVDQKEQKNGVPTPSEMTTYAREYIRSYLDTVDEKSPNNLPPLAQLSPYNIEICLLPNNCYAMILQSSSEMKVRATFRNWDDLQDLVVRGVDFLIGFYPHEMKSVGDWKKRGRRDAIRDIRMISESDIGKAAGALSIAIQDMSRVASTNPELPDQFKEHIDMMKGIEDRLKRGFAPIDGIAVLQDLKAYRPTYERMVIEYPDKAIMEKILEGIEELMSLQSRMETLESRMFDVERKSAIKNPAEEELPEIKENIGKLEGHLEKVSNILHLLNSKVEKYFTKIAEVERQATLEEKVIELSKKVDAAVEVVARIQSKSEGHGTELAKEVAKLENEIDVTRRKVKRLESHFVSLAKSVEE
ncbi:MAG: hypothetical protein OEV21_03145 [Thermoplasmata archaeon]|nr:hypothetical protein [Thermoplasmata archaeon]